MKPKSLPLYDKITKILRNVKRQKSPNDASATICACMHSVGHMQVRHATRDRYNIWVS